MRTLLGIVLVAVAWLLVDRAVTEQMRVLGFIAGALGLALIWVGTRKARRW